MTASVSFFAGERVANPDGTLPISALEKLNTLVARLEAAETTIAALADTYVAKDTTSSWTAWTGDADRATHATYTAANISNPPTEAEVQAIADAVQNVSRAFKAKLDDDLASGVNL